LGCKASSLLVEDAGQVKLRFVFLPQNQQGRQA
jgi:hypothetical protein